MAIRNVAIPLLSGGALLLGYAAFSWLRPKRLVGASDGPTTLREAGLAEPDESPSARAHRPSEPSEPTEHSEPREPREPSVTLTGPLSQRSPEFPDALELEIDFEDERSVQRSASLHEPVAPEDLGALFLARVTDALSPFGNEHQHFDIDQFDLEKSLLSEATARAAHAAESLEPREDPDELAESQPRPSSEHVGARS